MIRNHSLRRTGRSIVHCAAFAAALLVPLVCARAQKTFTFDDVEFWVGDGANRAVILIDWDIIGRRVGFTNSLAYGVRWNGTITQEQAVWMIEKEDPRLHFTKYIYGPDMFGYDINNSGGTFDPELGASDPADLMASCNFFGTAWNFYWAVSEFHGTSMTDSDDFDFCWFGFEEQPVYPNSFSSFKCIPWGDDIGNSLFNPITFDSDPYPDPFTGELVPVHHTPQMPVAAETPPFTFADVTFWVGNGVNQAVALIDFGTAGDAAGFSRSLAYGVRWNGEITQLAALRNIVSDDPRLHAGHEVRGAASLTIAYDLDGNGGAFNLAKGLKADPGDVIANFYQRGVALENTTAYSGDFAWSAAAADTQKVAPGSFIGFKHTGDWDFANGDHTQIAGIAPRRPVAANSPYGWRVVEYDAHSNGGPGGFNKPEAALGRPTTVDIVDYESDNFDIAPVTPFLPASSTLSVVRLTNKTSSHRAWITIEFDHAVEKKDGTPWGYDFIVFGNMLYSAAGGGSGGLTGFENPNSLTLVINPPLSPNNKPGTVSVAQYENGPWYEFTDGPYADTFIPTLGYRYEPAKADAGLFAGNEWWSTPTVPTYPVPTNAIPFLTQGTSLATIAKYYGKSAGGMPYKLSDLATPLPPNENGKPWFKFVKIQTRGSNSFTVVDAVALVYPDTEWGLWQKERYDWVQLSAPAVSGLNATSPNGAPNFLNFALGADDAGPVPELAINAFELNAGKANISFPVWSPDWNFGRLIGAGIELGLDMTTDLAAAFDGTMDIGLSRFESLKPGPWQGPHTATFSFPMPEGEDKAFFKLMLDAEEP